MDTTFIFSIIFKCLKKKRGLFQLLDQFPGLEPIQSDQSLYRMESERYKLNTECDWL
jgi:hypothetical protein